MPRSCAPKVKRLLNRTSPARRSTWQGRPSMARNSARCLAIEGPTCSMKSVSSEGLDMKVHHSTNELLVFECFRFRERFPLVLVLHFIIDSFGPLRFRIRVRQGNPDIHCFMFLDEAIDLTFEFPILSAVDRRFLR